VDEATEHALNEATDIPLADAIARLRDELIRAAQEGAGKGVRFRLGPVKLDLAVAATYSGGGEAGIRFWLVTIGGKAEASKARTHTIHLELQPVGEDDENLVVGAYSDEEPE
jgi:hypothetical protein